MIRESDWTYFSTGIAMLATAYSREISDVTLNTYWMLMYKFDRATFGWVVEECIENPQKYMPSPAELKKLAKAMYKKATPEQIRQREAQEKAYQDDLHAQHEALKADPERFARNKRRLSLLTDCIGGAHQDAPHPDCDSCKFRRAHPVAHLHLAKLPAGLTSADVDWNVPVAGCCQRALGGRA